MERVRAEFERLYEAGPAASTLYVTSSRDVAHRLCSMHGRVVASTGGPNTLVATALTPEVEEAIRMSATIENAGQCTALRHAVVPGASAAFDAAAKRSAQPHARADEGGGEGDVVDDAAGHGADDG